MYVCVYYCLYIYIYIYISARLTTKIFPRKIFQGLGFQGLSPYLQKCQPLEIIP